jgi:4-diphosphocytidyl-2-C-methyl-D-erythritol kinase
LDKHLSLYSHAKLNLTLSVLYLRKDKYHSLRSLLERISLADRIDFTRTAGPGISVRCSNPALACDGTNLAYKAAVLLQKTCGIRSGVSMYIRKRIPLGSGMGGGSSNAATVLLGLNCLWGAGLPKERLLKLAAKIGSDVSFFIHECSFAWVTGRGERVRPVEGLAGTVLWHVVVVPMIHVSTPVIFSEWDRAHPGNKPAGPALTTAARDDKIIHSVLGRRDIPCLQSYLRNDLEAVTLKLYPQVGVVRNRLRECGVSAILMSGSGPTVFGIVSSRKEALRVAREIGQLREWQVYVVKTA